MFVVLLATTMGHGEGGCGAGEGSVIGSPTESECPPSSPLTYANFGQAFMESYCTRCHRSDLVGAARMGAPSFHDFDTRSGVSVVADHIDETTASGPAAANDGMPPSGPFPTLAEREMLGEWLACGAPE